MPRKEHNYIQKCLLKQRRRLNDEMSDIVKMKCTQSAYPTMERLDRRVTEYHHDRIMQEKSLQRDLTKADRMSQRIGLILEKLRKDFNSIKNLIGNYNFVNTDGDDTQLSQALDTRQSWKDDLRNMIYMTRTYVNQQYLGNYTILHSYIPPPSSSCHTVLKYRDAFHYNTPMNDELCIANEVVQHRAHDGKLYPETLNHNKVSNPDLALEGMYLLLCVDPNTSCAAEDKWYTFLYCIVRDILKSHMCNDATSITHEIIHAIRTTFKNYNLPDALINAIIDVPEYCDDPNLKSFVQRLADHLLSESYTTATTTCSHSVPTGDWYKPSDDDPHHSQLNVVYGWYYAVAGAATIMCSIPAAQIHGIEDEADIVFVRDIVVYKMNEIRACQNQNDRDSANMKYVREMSESNQTYHEEVFGEMTQIDETELDKRYEVGKSMLDDLEQVYKENCVSKHSFFKHKNELEDGW
jgi:hypothetical protein